MLNELDEYLILLLSELDLYQQITLESCNHLKQVESNHNAPCVIYHLLIINDV